MVSRGLRRAALRSSAARSLRALTAVPKPHFAILVMWASVAFGLSRNAAMARARASVGLAARRLAFFCLREILRCGRPRGRPARFFRIS